MPKLLRQWLKVGVMEEGTVKTTTAGTRLGGVISPLLANVYLDELDRIWKATCLHLGQLVRYADDFLCPTKRQAEQALEKVWAIMGRLRLELHPAKTRQLELGLGKEGFEFLGCHLRIARLGGYLHRARDAPPGTWSCRGMARLTDIHFGFCLAKDVGN